MAIFLLGSVSGGSGAGAGTPVLLNGDIRNVNIQATSYGTGDGVILECKLDSAEPNWIPLTSNGAPAKFKENQSVIIPVTQNGMLLRARADTGCIGVYVTMLPDNRADN